MPTKKITTHASKGKGKAKPAPKGKGKPATPPGKGKAKPKPEPTLKPLSIVVTLIGGKLDEVTLSRKEPDLKLVVIEADGAMVDDLREAGEPVVRYPLNIGGGMSEPVVIRGSTTDGAVTTSVAPSFIENLEQATPEEEDTEEDTDDGDPDDDDIAYGDDDDDGDTEP